MSSRSFQFAAEAQVDLEEIVAYTTSEWGGRQAEVYRSRLDDAFARIAKFPSMGMRIAEHGRDVRRITVAEHHIFYEVLADSVTVIRVTHVRIDEPDLSPE